MKDMAVKRATRLRLDLDFKKGGLKIIVGTIVLAVFAKLLLSYIDAPDVPVCFNTTDISVKVAGRQYYNTYYIDCLKGDQNVHAH
jgi:hypothetical protein